MLGFSQKSDHIVKPSIGLYLEHIQFFNPELAYGSNLYPGLELNFKHSVRGINWIGTDFGILYNTDEELPTFYLGIAIRKSFFEDKMAVHFLLPRMSMPFDGWRPIGYNTPFGFEFRFGKEKVRVKISTLFYNNGVVNRLTVFYKILK
jgi:hypothetical protein